MILSQNLPVEDGSFQGATHLSLSFSIPQYYLRRVIWGLGRRLACLLFCFVSLQILLESSALQNQAAKVEELIYVLLCLIVCGAFKVECPCAGFSQDYIKALLLALGVERYFTLHKAVQRCSIFYYSGIWYCLHNLAQHNRENHFLHIICSDFAKVRLCIQFWSWP